MRIASVTPSDRGRSVDLSMAAHPSKVQTNIANTQTCGCTGITTNPCANGLNGRASPRLVAVPVFDRTLLANLGPGGTLSIKNIVGLFLLEPGVGDPMNPNNAPCVDPAHGGTGVPETICGYLTTFPGELVSGGSTFPQGETLNILVSLIQ